MNPIERETEAIRSIAEDLENEGYEVSLEVNLHHLAPEFSGFRADIVAARGDATKVIEVKRKRMPSVDRRLNELKQSVENRPNWSFEVRYLDELKIRSGPRAQTNSEISATNQRVRKMLKTGIFDGAFLLGWASFEAASRRVYSQIFARPQSPGRLITVLAEKGIVDVEEASMLRHLMKKRNLLIHGELDQDITSAEVEQLLQIVERVQSHSSPPKHGDAA